MAMRDNGTFCFIRAGFLFVLAAMMGGGLCFGAEDGVIDFARDIQPVLSDNCYHCHGPDAEAREGDLRLDTEAGAMAKLGDHFAIKPGAVDESVLIDRIYAVDDDVMPPADSNRVLTDDQKQLLRDWIAQGAHWAEHWAFAEVPRLSDIAVPGLEGDGAGVKRHPIDGFIGKRLEVEKLTAMGAADRRTLIRRVTLDLTGLAPTPDEVAEFLSDKKANAYARLVDRLLGSEAFGERMAWPWLDAARYSDTNGYQQDPTRTMWPWRDWVIGAINENKPFDKFAVEQLAGDLLPNASVRNKIASGFNRNNMHNGEGGRIPEETRVENVFDRTETTATTFLGLTFTCARCHDHKFDPISQVDYYGLYAFFNQITETGKGSKGQVAPTLDITTAEQHEKLEAVLAKRNAVGDEVLGLEAMLFPREKGKPITDSAAIEIVTPSLRRFMAINPRNRNISAVIRLIDFFGRQAKVDAKFKAYAGALKRLRDEITVYTDYAASMPRVMVMDTIKEPRTTQILTRGAYDKPVGDEVEANTPSALPGLGAGDGETLNRLDLAKWIVSRENPLTARVIVNRYWQSIFGRGLVKTPEDFGLQGSAPTHPQLLDYLAARFVQTNWNVKQLLRFIVLSQTYKRSATATKVLLERDPENLLLARSPRYRLPSWMLRDQALAVSGLLVKTVGGPPVKPYQPAGLWDEATFGKIKYVADTGEKLYRRTLYTFWRRIVGPTVLFDNAKRQTCTVNRTLTNTPLHALVTLNETGYVEAGRAMAERVMGYASNDAKRINYAFLLATARTPSKVEHETLMGRLGILKGQFAERPSDAAALLEVGDSKADGSLDAVEHAAYAALCSLILNLDETLTRP